MSKLIQFDENELNKYEFKSIRQLCRFLVKHNISISIVEFIKFVHSEFYPDMDISFLDYSLKICKYKNEFIIDPIVEFVNLGVKDKEIRSNNLLKIINQCEFVKGVNYDLLLRSEQQVSGTKHKKVYLLTPDAFKIMLTCLDNSQQRLKFAQYFSLFEKCVAHYNDGYQYKLTVKTIAYLESLNEKKDCKIDKLLDKVDKQSIQLDDQSVKLESQSKEIQELIGHTKDIKKQNYKLDKKVTAIKNTLQTVSEDVAVSPVNNTQEKLKLIFS